MPPVIVAAAITTAGVVGSGLIASSGAQKAASTQAGAATEALDFEKQMYEESKAMREPFLKTELERDTMLMEKLRAGPGEFRPEEDPGYEFGYREGVEKPLLAGQASRGAIGSGKTLKALSRYSQDYASTKYDNFLDRWYQSLRPLQGVPATTQAGASEAMRHGMSGAQRVQNIGDARASGYASQADIWSGAAASGAQNIADAYYLSKTQPVSALPPSPARDPYEYRQ